MGVERRLNRSRTAVESKTNRSCKTANGTGYYQLNVVTAASAARDLAPKRADGNGTIFEIAAATRRDSIERPPRK